jgi:hypothetical protein
MQRRAWAAAGLSAFLVTGVAIADDYDETAGDLSNVASAPTLVNLTSGGNKITGTTGTGSGSVDLDYFRVNVPAGMKLVAIDLLSYDGPSQSFIGVERGTAFTDAASTSANPRLLLGYTHFNSSMIGTDVLDDIGAGAGSQGFTGPLGPGDYSFWIQENSTPVVHYQFSLMLSTGVPALPAPFGVLLFAGLGLGGVALFARRGDPLANAG